jgi:nitrate reductase NapAB chaperone NapD
MKESYQVGNLTILSDDATMLVIFQDLLDLPDVEIIGMTRKGNIIKRIRRDSVWGKKLLEYYQKIPILPMSENEKRLKLLINPIGKSF